ncbi:DUF2938 domain-containing protein [Pseudomonas shirazensis]|uniref:DUF2938 domain-containing protein n=1 Tax=Pseudomonas shirazensis TaxID=2745494 RepID=UPI003D27AAF8
MGVTVFLISTLVIGIGATLVMDVWAMLLRRLGVSTLNYAMLGRWAGHLLRGRVRHVAIANAEPIRHERVLGWALHYAIGLLFAAALLALQGADWLHAPTLLPALTFGLCTVVAPLCILQPAMGAGWFASKTPAPFSNSLRSVATHLVFGSGLYATALLLSRV